MTLSGWLVALVLVVASMAVTGLADLIERESNAKSGDQGAEGATREAKA